MALRGKYEQSHVAVKVIQWLGCMFVLSIPAMGSIFWFEQPLSVGALKWVQFIQTVEEKGSSLLLTPLFIFNLAEPDNFTIYSKPYSSTVLYTSSKHKKSL